MLKTVLANLLNRKHCAEDGVTTVEYSIMCVMIGIAVAGFGQALHTTVTGVYATVIQIIFDAG